MLDVRDGLPVGVFAWQLVRLTYKYLMQDIQTTIVECDQKAKGMDIFIKTLN